MCVKRLSANGFPQALYDGLIDTLRVAIDERINRFIAFCGRLGKSNQKYKKQMDDSTFSKGINQKIELFNNRDQAGELLSRCLVEIKNYENKAFVSIIRKRMEEAGSVYIDVIKSLDNNEALLGTQWLQQIVDEVTGQMLALFPSIR